MKKRTPKFTILLAFLIVSLLMISCDSGGGNEDCDEEHITRDVEDLLTIDQGVYGQVTSHDDIGENFVEYYPGFQIDVFLSKPTGDPNNGAVAYSTASSGERGFYEIPLPAGTYWLCSSFRRCTTIEVVENELVRRDYEFGVGPGWVWTIENY